MANIIFMGTPDFAVPSLKVLHRAFNVVGVVTQPDRRSGRGRKLQFSAVKQAAQALGLPILQPAGLKDPAAVASLQALNPDVIVVAAFGQILRANVLDMPPYGCINVHASLLPRWRGAAPIAYAIRAGDTQTGVTIMQMDPGLDTGPMLSRQAIDILPQHTAGSLTAELAEVGADLLLKTLPAWLAGDIAPQPQPQTGITLAPSLKKSAGAIDWQQPADAIERQIRAFDPWPGSFTHWGKQRIKILAANVVSHAPALPVGTVTRQNGALVVTTGEGALQLQQIQPAGKKPMRAFDFSRGATDFIGAQLQ